MAYSDDLDEFDSELEISLKREYSDVFPLFNYCVITQEATYLCNKLDMDAAPSSSFLLFEIRMEDVWVWDRNRPTRIIPRAQIYTTSDVTVEQLKESDVADFDAAIPESLAEQLRANALGADSDDEDEDEEDGEGDGDDAADVTDTDVSDTPDVSDVPDVPDVREVPSLGDGSGGEAADLRPRHDPGFGSGGLYRPPTEH